MKKVAATNNKVHKTTLKCLTLEQWIVGSSTKQGHDHFSSYMTPELVNPRSGHESDHSEHLGNIGNSLFRRKPSSHDWRVM